MLKVNEYGGRQTKVNEKRQCFKGWETLVIKDIYHPKAVVCFSIPDCFTPFINRLNIKEVESIVPPMVNGEPAKRGVTKAMWGDIKIIGIPHPSGRISYEDLGAIAMYLQNEL